MPPTEQLEIETKYDVDQGFSVPDLAGLRGVATVAAPVEHLLEAVYLDTDEPGGYEPLNQL